MDKIKNFEEFPKDSEEQIMTEIIRHLPPLTGPKEIAGFIGNLRIELPDSKEK